MKFSTLIPVLLLVMISCHTSRKAPVADEMSASSSRLNRIKMTDLSGQPFSLDKFTGRPIFLNFWATWCAPCISEMESIADLYGMYGDEVVFLAVTTESLTEIEDFRADHPFPFEFAQLNIDYIEAFVITLPTTLLIDRSGTIRHEEEGATIWTLENNIQRIRDLLQ